MAQVMISNYLVGTVFTGGTFDPATYHTGGFSTTVYEGNLLLSLYCYPVGGGTVTFTVQGGTVAGSAAANWSTLSGSAMVAPASSGTALAGGTIVFNPVVSGGSIFQQIELVREYCPPYIRLLPVVVQGTWSISCQAFGLEKYG